MSSFKSGGTREEPCRFGIPILDETLGGGYSRGAVVLIEDEVGVDANPLLVQFLAEGIQSGEYGYILSTEHLYETYRQLLIPFGIDEIVVDTKRLVFLDGFSTPFAGEKPGALQSRSAGNVVRNILEARNVLDTIRQSLLHVRTPNVRGVFDSISSVLLVAGENLQAPVSLLSQIIANNKAKRHNTIFTIHADVHHPRVIKALEHFCDGVLKLTYFNGKPILRIVKVEGYQNIDQRDFLYHPEPGKVNIEPLE